MNKALIIVDVQKDFLPGGALPVPGGDEVVGEINYLMPMVDEVVATKDWHPRNHRSFASNHPGKKAGDVVNINGVDQILWPDHCIADSLGSEFAPGLRHWAIDATFTKGENPNEENYSGFFDGKDGALNHWLRSAKVNQVFIAGLALDYCVKATALDAKRLGYFVTVMVPACRWVSVQTGAAAIDEMTKAGIFLLGRTAVPA